MKQFTLTAAAIGLGFVGCAFFVWTLVYLGRNDSAYYRRVERAKIEVQFCRDRGGSPKFDADNFVIGCDR